MFLPSQRLDYTNEITFYGQYLLNVLSNFQARQDEEFAFTLMCEFARCESHCYDNLHAGKY
jgi:hypothetical protein